MNPERERILTNRIDRADKFIKFSLMGAGVFILIGMVIVIAQLVNIQALIERNLITSRAQAAANHQRTQQYVKCVAEALLKPLAQRKETDFDKCGIQTDGTQQKAQEGGKATGAEGVVKQPPKSVAAVVPAQPLTTDTDPPITTSAPPDSNKSTNAASAPEQSRPNLVSDLVLGVGKLIQGVGL